MSTKASNELSADQREQVIAAALALAQHWEGIRASPEDVCHVEPVVPMQGIWEGGHWTAIPHAVWQWQVYIAAKSPPNARPTCYQVDVEAPSGTPIGVNMREVFPSACQ
jgi:hypothetical protein